MSKRGREEEEAEGQDEEPTAPEREKRQYKRHSTPERAEIRGAEVLRQKLIADGLITRSAFSRSDLFALFGVSDRTGYQILKRPSARMFGHNEGDVETRGRPRKVRDEEEDGCQRSKANTSAPQNAKKGKGKKTKEASKGGTGAQPSTSSSLSSRPRTTQSKKTAANQSGSNLLPSLESFGSCLVQPDQEVMVADRLPVGEDTFAAASTMLNGIGSSDRFKALSNW